MRVLMCVCVCVCVCERVSHACTDACTHVCASDECSHVCTDACTHVCARRCVHSCVGVTHLSVNVKLYEVML